MISWYTLTCQKQEGEPHDPMNFPFGVPVIIKFGEEGKKYLEHLCEVNNSPGSKWIVLEVVPK